MVYAKEQVASTFKKVFPYILAGVAIAVAEALFAKGAQLGTILSFVMAVTTLSLPSIIMFKKAVKPKLLGIFIAICTIGIEKENEKKILKKVAFICVHNFCRS